VSKKKKKDNTSVIWFHCGCAGFFVVLICAFVSFVFLDLLFFGVFCFFFCLASGASFFLA